MGAPLTNAYKRRRLNWCNQHRRLAARQWRNTLFTDETKIMTDVNDRRQLVFRRNKERFAEACVGRSIWDGVSYGLGRHKSPRKDGYRLYKLSWPWRCSWAQRATTSTRAHITTLRGRNSSPCCCAICK